MTWDITKAAFADELEKIAEVNLSGVSPERVSTMFEGAPPMETTGYNQAKSVLQKMQQVKTAAPIPRLPQLKRLTRPGMGNKEDGPPPDAIDKAKHLGGHMLAGAGAGRFVAEFTPKSVDPKKKFIGTALGAGLGAVEYARKAHRQKQWENREKTAAFSPAMALKASSQVGAKMGARPVGVTSVKSIIPKIKAPPKLGHTGVPNLV
jgi:hypothetical protein